MRWHSDIGSFKSFEKRLRCDPSMVWLQRDGGGRIAHVTAASLMEEPTAFQVEHHEGLWLAAVRRQEGRWTALNINDGRRQPPKGLNGVGTRFSAHKPPRRLPTGR